MIDIEGHGVIISIESASEVLDDHILCYTLDICLELTHSSSLATIDIGTKEDPIVQAGNMNDSIGINIGNVIADNLTLQKCRMKSLFCGVRTVGICFVQSL